MRNFTQKLTALAAVGWLSLTTALAGDQFVPKEYSYKNVGMSSQSTINIPMTDLFTYPDGMDATANLDEAGVKAEFEFMDENVVGLYKYEYYSFGKVQQLYLMRKGGYVTGAADVKVKLTYNGETVENTLDIDIVSVIAKDDEYTADLGQALMMPVLNNDNFMKNGDKANATIEILQAPVNGQATIVEGADGAQDTIKYVQNEGLDNYSFDELKYKVTLLGSYRENQYSQECIRFARYRLPAGTGAVHQPTVHKRCRRRDIGNKRRHPQFGFIRRICHLRLRPTHHEQPEKPLWG